MAEDAPILWAENEGGTENPPASAQRSDVKPTEKRPPGGPSEPDGSRKYDFIPFLIFAIVSLALLQVAKSRAPAE